MKRWLPGIVLLALVIGGAWALRADAQVPNTAKTTKYVALQFTVAASATPVQLSTIAGVVPYARQFTIEPKASNTKGIEVRSAQSTPGYQLGVGAQKAYPCQNDLSTYWIYVGVDGEGACIDFWSDQQ